MDRMLEVYDKAHPRARRPKELHDTQYHYFVFGTTDASPWPETAR
jgi:hypothetical protein